VTGTEIVEAALEDALRRRLTSLRMLLRDSTISVGRVAAVLGPFVRCFRTGILGRLHRRAFWRLGFCGFYGRRDFLIRRGSLRCEIVESFWRGSTSPIRTFAWPSRQTVTEITRG
jgi:hypothetical protein